jgi:hypothetical protein
LAVNIVVPAAFALRVETKLKWSVWLDSNQRPLRSERSALTGLRYTPLISSRIADWQFNGELAPRREIESLCADRQSAVLAR